MIRLIQGANRWDHTNKMFYNDRILKSNYIVEIKTILFMFDAYHNILSKDFQQCKIYSNIFCTQSTSSYERKHMRAMSIPVSQGPRVPKTGSRENHLPKAIFLFECYH